MERTKLTVRVDRRWVDQAKRYAARRGTSLSKLISDYLETLSDAPARDGDAPVLRRLTGILPSDTDVDAYYRHLEEKHLG
jgi:hypothetical protein